MMSLFTKLFIASLPFAALSLSSQQPASAFELPKCKGFGNSTLTVKNRTGVPLKVKVATNLRGQPTRTFRPGQSHNFPVCHPPVGGFRLHLYTMGGTKVGESRFVRMWGGETATITNKGVKFQAGDLLQGGSTIAGMALIYLGNSYAVPPELLASLGVKEAQVYSDCRSLSSPVKVVNCAMTIKSYMGSTGYDRFISDKSLDLPRHTNDLPRPTPNPDISYKPNCSEMFEEQLWWITNGSDEEILVQDTTYSGRNLKENKNMKILRPYQRYGITSLTLDTSSQECTGPRPKWPQIKVRDASGVVDIRTVSHHFYGDQYPVDPRCETILILSAERYSMLRFKTPYSGPPGRYAIQKKGPDKCHTAGIYMSNF